MLVDEELLANSVKVDPGYRKDGVPSSWIFLLVS